MKKYEVDKIRNVGILGHGSDGKTSLADAILFDTGMNNRMGDDDCTTAAAIHPPHRVQPEDVKPPKIPGNGGSGLES